MVTGGVAFFVDLFSTGKNKLCRLFLESFSALNKAPHKSTCDP